MSLWNVGTRLSIFVIPILVLGCSYSADTAKKNRGGSKNAENKKDAEKSASKEMSLEVADLEKLGTWEETASANAKLTEKLAEVMDSITDKASAAAAIGKFKGIGSRFAAVNRARKKLGEVTKKEKSGSLKILASANAKFDKAYTKLKENDELFKMVEEALDKAYVGDES